MRMKGISDYHKCLSNFVPLYIPEEIGVIAVEVSILSAFHFNQIMVIGANMNS